MIAFLLNWDQALEQYIYLHRYKDADSFLTWATVNATYISFALLFFLVIIYFFNKKQIYLYVALSATLVNGISALITNTLKILIERPRPYKMDELIDTPLSTVAVSAFLPDIPLKFLLCFSPSFFC